MCNICKELVACPVGEKRKVLIDKVDDFTDFYGRKFTTHGKMFVIDKFPEYTDCFIVDTYTDENSVEYGFCVDGIKFCPFCGEKLVCV